MNRNPARRAGSPKVEPHGQGNTADIPCGGRMLPFIHKQLGRPAIIADHGASHHYPPNSEAAIRAAFLSGADAVLIDATMTSDNVLVACPQTWRGMKTSEKTLATLASFGEGLDDRPMSLKSIIELRDTCDSEAAIILHIDSQGTEAKIIDAFNAISGGDVPFAISSCNEHIVRSVRKAFATVGTMYRFNSTTYKRVARDFPEIDCFVTRPVFFGDKDLSRVVDNGRHLVADGGTSMDDVRELLLAHGNVSAICTSKPALCVHLLALTSAGDMSL